MTAIWKKKGVTKGCTDSSVAADRQLQRLMSILEVTDSKGKEELPPGFQGTLLGHKIILMKEML